MTEVERLFKINVAHIQNLDGDINYSNQKFALTDAFGKKYILKIFPDEKEWQLAKEESIILDAIGKKLSFRVPQNIRLADGSLFFQHTNGPAKLLDYIDGKFIADVPHTPQLLYSLGEKIAELDVALQAVESSLIASRRLFWDIQNAQYSISKLQLIKAPEQRKIVEFYLDRFVNFVLPVQHTLRHSIIHGDLNDYNTLTEDNKIAGFLDFGDSTYSPLINELAVAMTYMMLDKANPFEEIVPLLQGYHKYLPLTREEIELLPDLITARLCISVCNSAEKKSKGLDNEYVLISEKPAWALLHRWMQTNPLKIKKLFLEAAGFQYNHGNVYDEVLDNRLRFAGKSLGLSYRQPVQMTSALFQYMFDEKGNTYLDCYNNIPHIGHSHPAVSKAISLQARTLNTNTRYLYEAYNELCDALLKYFPQKLNKIFLVNSGSEANDLAIRMARTYTGKNKVAVLEHGYHGNTTLGIEISSYKFEGKGGKGISDNIIKLPLPNLFRGKFKTTDEFVNDAVHILESNDKPCAFIAEPISGCGGQVPLGDGYLKHLYTHFSQQGIVAINDEVQTGFGRLGSWFWGFDMHGVGPDIVVLGKPMGNGHPVAAVVTTTAIADAFANGMEFFSSFGGNAVSCKVATTVLKIIEEEQLQENAKTVGAYFKSCLLDLKKSHSAIADIRGEGLFLGIEFQTPEQTPGTQIAGNVKNKLKEFFMLTDTDGPFDNVIKIKPPLCFTKDNADSFIERISDCLKSEG